MVDSHPMMRYEEEKGDHPGPGQGLGGGLDGGLDHQMMPQDIH